MLRVCLSFAAFVGCCFLLAGCGERTVTVDGRIVLLPNTSLKDDDSIQLAFVETGGNKTVGALGKPDGKEASFTAQVPPGSYKITVTIRAYAGHKESEKRDAQFKSLNKAFSHDATTLTYEVTGDAKQSVTIDLAKGRVSKN